MRKRGRRLGLLGLIGAGLTSLLPGCFVDKEVASKPYVETAVVSDYVLKHGGAVRGQVRQDFLKVGLNERLSVFMWQNYSEEEGTFNERDFGVNYAWPVNDRLSARINLMYFDFPSGTFGDYASALRGGVNRSGAVDLDLDVTQLLPNSNIDSGTRCALGASKKIKIPNTGVSVTPSVNTAYVNHYNGLTGLSQVSPGLSLSVGKGGFNAKLFVTRQFGLIPKIQDFTWGGASVGYKF